MTKSAVSRCTLLQQQQRLISLLLKLQKEKKTCLQGKQLVLSSKCSNYGIAVEVPENTLMELHLRYIYNAL